MADLEAMFLHDTQEETVETGLTAQQVLSEIQEAWNNEKLCPELLPHKAELVEIMMEQIDQMEENVSRLENTDLRSVIHKMELERIRYVMRSYLRTRLEKIETYSLWLLKPEAERWGSSQTISTLSPQESAYLKDFITATLEHFKTTTNAIPGPMASLSGAQMEIKPELETHVVVRSRVNEPGIVVRDETSSQREEEVDLKEGSQHIIPYSAVRTLVREGKVVLI